jgi:NADH:ubiquinone oxidoreductase, NADH-binding (51 kD) subunit
MLLTEQEKTKEFIGEVVNKYPRQASSLLSILWAVQVEYGYVSDFSMQYIGDLLDISPAKIYGVATFYHFINRKPQGKFIIRLSRDIASIMKGALVIARQLENILGIPFGETTTDGMFTLRWVNGIGLDDQVPAMLVNNTAFSNLTSLAIPQIIEECKSTYQTHQALVGKCKETVTNTLIYAEHQSNSGLRKAVQLSPEQVLAEIASSGLCGRGGAGFPTGKKWKMAASMKSDMKYLICNADEGEPGTFKDRVILSRFADTLIEGMTIAAYAIEASQGIIYLRAEYAYLRPQLEQVLKVRQEAGLLGENILGIPNFTFEIRIQMGAGAYVCGEETALIESLEGNRGEPRDRPPYPVEAGLDGKPTVVNNVETLATVSMILERGAAWFSNMGTERSKGFKLFSVSGDCLRPGLYDLPWGHSISEILMLVGGEQAKAVQVGGYSGKLWPASAFGRRLAYEDLGPGSSIIIYGPERDLLWVAQYYLEFFVEESCGQCIPCRDGNVVLLNGIRALRDGRCSEQQLTDLLDLADTMRLTAKCGLGQSSPNILIALNQYFRDELITRRKE